MLQLFALLAQQPTDKPAGGLFGDPTMLIMMALIFVAFYFIVIMPMKRREKKEREDLFTKLKKNDEVLTASGIIGLIAMVKDDEVILKVDESSNVRLRVLKSSIVRVMNTKDATGQEGQAAENARAATPPAKKSRVRGVVLGKVGEVRPRRGTDIAFCCRFCAGDRAARIAHR